MIGFGFSIGLFKFDYFCVGKKENKIKIRMNFYKKIGKLGNNSNIIIGHKINKSDKKTKKKNIQQIINNGKKTEQKQHKFVH